MRSRYASPEFWVRAFDQAAKASAAAMVSVTGTNLIGVTDVDWAQNLSIGALTAILSVLTSVATAKEPPMR